MHAKSMSTSTAGTVLGRGAAEGLAEQNRMLREDNYSLRDQLAAIKAEMLAIYAENLDLKQTAAKSKDMQFVKQCENEIRRLKDLVGELMEVGSLGPSEREEIKDRIIMRLEDELISAKIQLKEAKYKS